MKLSVLDQSPVSAGMTPADALQNTIALAKLADELGYHRYWIAEHHAMPSLASPAPEILLARIGAETSRIRIGSGAILLPHYAPLKVVEQFRMLHALYPDRIDLGLGRAPGGTGLEAAALRRGVEGDPSDQFPQLLLELLAFLERRFPADHPYGRIHVAPDMPGGPEVWLLGSSMWSAQAAAQLGLPYAFAQFISPQETPNAMALYRQRFVPVEPMPAPHGMTAVGVLCAPTDEEAQFLFASSRLAHRRIRRGVVLPIPAPEDALAELGDTPPPATEGSQDWPRYVVGDPATVRRQLTRIADALGTDEVMAITIVHSHEARMRSYRLLAAAFE